MRRSNKGKILNGQRPGFAENNRPFHGVFQFSHVSRPTVVKEGGHRLVPGDALPLAAAARAEVAVTDDRGVEIRLPEPPRRPITGT